MKYVFLLAFIASGTLLAGGQVQAANAGDLIKCPDFTEVYYLAEDGDRHVFQNENSFHSWYIDFDEVRHISCDDLAMIPIGGVVHYREGTRLVKSPSVPTVYFVAPDGLLRSIQSEEQAEALFGADWADQVDDLDESFIVQYEIGEALLEDELPEGLILEDDDGDIFRVDADGNAEEIDDLLDEDENEIYHDSSHDLEDLEEKLGLEIALEALEENLERITQEVQGLLKAIEVLEGLIESFEDIEDGDEEDIRALDALEDAQEEIEEAVLKLEERELAGKDISEAENILELAMSLLDEAEAAYGSGDFFLAEELADLSRDAANEAREGEHADSVDEEEDEEDESIDDLDDGTDDSTEDEEDDSSEIETDDSTDDDSTEII